MDTTKWARRLSLDEIPAETMMVPVAEALASPNLSFDACTRAALEAAAAVKAELAVPVLAKRPYGFEIDPDTAYPFWLSLLGFPSSPTKQQAECARLCATEYLHRQVKFEAFLDSSELSEEEKALVRRNPALVDREKIRTTAAGLYVKITKRSVWALSSFPDGSAIDAVAEYARLLQDGKVEV